MPNIHESVVFISCFASNVFYFFKIRKSICAIRARVCCSCAYTKHFNFYHNSVFVVCRVSPVVVNAVDDLSADICFFIQSSTSVR